jgi:hypothetical protein
MNKITILLPQKNKAMIQIENTDLYINSAQAKFTGYGHYLVTVELYYKNKYKEFSRTITDMQAIDEAKELGIESWEDKAQRLYDAISSKIEDNVNEWIQEINFDEE